MSNNREQENLEFFKKAAVENVSSFADKLTLEYFDKALSIIDEALASGNRVHVTGIGKPGHVASYAASLLSSTGTPSTFLHGTEAVHGSCGQLVPGDVVICISNSGETEELKRTVEAVKNYGCRIIGLSGGKGSWLDRNSDVCLIAKVTKEGGPLNRAPMSSVLVECMALQGLAIMLETQCGLTVKDYIKRHPGGKLGQLRKDETGDEKSNAERKMH